MPAPDHYSAQVRKAVRTFWNTRFRQSKKQGLKTGQRDAGNRTAATGGKQLDGFSKLFVELLVDSGIPRKCVFYRGHSGVTLPGFFRPTKQWDVLVVQNGNLLASIECKALCGPSFGNNYNNRIEEALGSATDTWTAYRDGAFSTSPKPFLGYLLLLEDDVGSRSPVKVQEKHFPVFSSFNNASYAGRCEESLRRLLRERVYDSTAFILSAKRSGLKGMFSEPATDLTFHRFATLMCGHVTTAIKALDEN
ncbi:MAG: restriction endonuclease [Planctomycetes bacterium]|nr:restriction endonuclease [Planctomycetota bacterium]